MRNGFLVLLGILLTFTLGWKTSDNLIKLGDGTNSDKTITADIGLGALNPKLEFDSTTAKWQFTNDGVNVRDIGSGSGSGSGINLLDNPGCENGASTPDDWTASGGALTRTTVAGEVGFESAACKWDASATSQTLTPANVAVPNALEARPCVAEILYKADSITAGDYSLKAELDDGTDLTAELALQPTSGAWRQAFVSFQCPTDDSIRFTVESEVSNPDAILIDQTHLGSNKNDLLAGDPSEVVTRARFAATGSCTWTRTGTSPGAFATNASCPAITVESSSPTAVINAADTDLPQLAFSSLPAGKYLIHATFTGDSTAANTEQAFSIHDGVAPIARSDFFSDAGTNAFQVHLTGFIDHSGGAKTFAINCAAASGECRLDNSPSTSGFQSLTWTVTRFPASSASKVTLETQGWFIDANVAGANPSLGTSTVSTYAEITNSALTMATNGASVAAQIPCSTTNPPTGSTCAAGNESVGVAFTPPYTGVFQVCAAFAHSVQLDSTGVVISTFKLVETGESNQTVITDGFERMQNRKQMISAGNDEATTNPISVCGFFNFSSISKKVIRLFYAQTAAAPIDSNNILADAAAGADGNREINFKVIPLTQNFPQAVAIASVPTNSCVNGENICSGFFTSVASSPTNLDGTPTVQEGNFMRVGNAVTYSFLATVDPTADVITVFQATVPQVVSNFAASRKGLGTCSATAGTPQAVWYIETLAATTRIQLVTTKPQSLSSHSLYCHLTYSIL